jgi:hypothetical protein
MSTVRTNATGQGSGSGDVTVDPANAPQKAVTVNASTTVRVDAEGGSEGTTIKHTQTAAIVPA